MRIFFDTEFLETPDRLELISVGAVTEAGREFYAETVFDWSRATEWLLANVRPHCHGRQQRPSDIAASFASFAEGVTEFWAYYGAYDWTLVCRLYGGLLRLPPGWPQIYHEAKILGIRPHQNRHDALDDARQLRKAMPRV